VSNHHTELFYTPLIINSPQLSGKIVEQPTSNVDIFPTLLELVGIKKMNGLQGYSLMPYINGQNKILRPFIFSEVGKGGIILQNKNWLYYLSNDDSASTVKDSELYNKITDPQEKDNVATKYPELTQSLYKQAMILRSYETKTIFNFDEIKLDPEKIKRLQKEGYF
jgi:arylsulfatase A-like enzyme